MDTGVAVKITYWAEQTGDSTLRDFRGIDEFRREVTTQYVGVVRGRPGDLGGLYHLTVELIANIRLADIAGFLLSNLAWDFIKAGTTSFVLRPLIQAYRRLRERNEDFRIDVNELRVVFQDSVLLVHRLGEDSIFSHLESVITAVAREYRNFTLPSGETPSEVSVPVFEDETEDAVSRFRELLDVDETITPTTADYQSWWGLRYDFSRSRVYDVQRHRMLDEKFLSSEEYWREWDQRERIRNARGSS